MRRVDVGFSLIELMVAMSLLGIGLLTIGKMIVSSRRHMTYSRAETSAVSLATEIKERIFTEDFVNIKAVFDDADTADPSTINDSTNDWANHVGDLLGVTGRGQIEIVDTVEDDTLPPDLYRVEILISWSEGGIPRDLPHTILMSKVGI
jgi:prepilin-type N-terminal cleavage/methylation domain-containing protein